MLLCNKYSRKPTKGKKKKKSMAAVQGLSMIKCDGISREDTKTEKITIYS